MTPIPRLGQGVACGQSQWAAPNGAPRALHPRPVLSCWSGLVWPGLPRLSLLSAPAGNGVTDHPPRPELLFDAPAPAPTGHAPARPGNPSDILQETQTIRNTPVKPRHSGQTARQTVEQLDRIWPYSGRVGGRTVDRCTPDRSSVSQSPGRTSPKHPKQASCALCPVLCRGPRALITPISDRPHRHHHRRHLGTAGHGRLTCWAVVAGQSARCLLPCQGWCYHLGTQVGQC